MVRLLPLTSLALFLALTSAQTSVSTEPSVQGIVSSIVCKLVDLVTSPATMVSYPGSQTYANDISHATNTSSESAMCSVEPATPQDVAAIILALGLSQTQFGVKGGGHAYGVHMSSTTGVEIAMTKFNQVTLNKNAGTVTVGTGQTWDKVYLALDGTGYVVAGGRVPGVGVAGLSLGGGYSWKTNQVGLTVDTIVGYELVLPTGLIVDVTSSLYPDLFWALKGGWNNFGIVTSITYTAIPQGEVWGGQCDYNAAYLNATTAAAIAFNANNTDPKAGLLYSYVFTGGMVIASIQMFYDGPNPPAGTFDTFLNTPSLFCVYGTQTFGTLISTFPNVVETRGMHDTVPLTGYPPAFMAAMLNETLYWGNKLYPLDNSLTLAYTMEPFHSDILTHAAQGSSAYPPSRSQVYYPSSMDWSYTSASLDSTVLSAVESSTTTLRNKAVSLGQPVAFGAQNVVKYGNYALRQNTQPSDIWGTNVQKLISISQKYDPGQVMHSLTGGWKFY